MTIEAPAPAGGAEAEGCQNKAQPPGYTNLGAEMKGQAGGLPDLRETFEFARRNRVTFLPLRQKGDGKGKAPLEEGWQGKNYTEANILPGCNLGFKCGSASGGLVVLDYDSTTLFDVVFPKEKGDIGSKTTLVKTRRGFHVYLRVEDGTKSRAIEMASPEGEAVTFSVLAEGRIVVAPGSVHPNGGTYKFVSDNGVAAVCAQELEELIARTETKALELGFTVKKGQEPFDVQAALAQPPRIGQGSDDRTFRIVTFCRMVGLGKDETCQVLTAWWRGSPDYNSTSSSWIEQKIASAWRPQEAYRFKFSQSPKTAKVEGGRLVFSESGISAELLRAIAEAKESATAFDPAPVADAIMERYHFKTLEDTREVLVYEQGIYTSRGVVVIEREVGRLLRMAGKRATREKASEVVAAIRRSTYTRRDAFDPTPHLLCVENGILDLRTKELKSHSPELLFVTKIPVTYDPSAECPRIMEFMHQVHHEQDIPIAQEVFGYCLWTDYHIQKSLMLLGPGNNGKSTWLALHRTFIGSKNCSSATLQELGYNRFSTAELYGKLANIAPDLPSTKITDAGRFKALTGGDQITAERKGQSPFRFVNYAKLMFSANKLPEVGDNSDAFFRRWLIMNFPNTFTDKTADKNLLAKMTTPEELSGLLNWALVGLSRLLTNGRFSDERTTDEIREDYTRKSNPQAGFFQDCVEVYPDATIPKVELYEAYANYCDANALPKVSPPVFARDHLPKHAPSARSVKVGGKGKQLAAWQGIQLMKGCPFGPRIPNLRTPDTTLDGIQGGPDPGYQPSGPGGEGGNIQGIQGIQDFPLPGKGQEGKEYCNSPTSRENVEEEEIGKERKDAADKGVGAKTLDTPDTLGTTLPQSQRNPLVYNTVRDLVREAQEGATFVSAVVAELRGLLPEAEALKALRQLEYEGRIIVHEGEVRLV